jgi:DNA-binding MarR family transcriptional regulator
MFSKITQKFHIILLAIYFEFYYNYVGNLPTYLKGVNMKREYGIEIWRLLHQFARMNKKSYKLPNLTELETRVLYNVNFYKQHHDIGINIRDLKNKLNVSSPTISQVINDLENRDFVKRVRDKNDKRVTRVEVSELGSKELKKAVDIVEAKFVKLGECLGEEKSKQLIEILTQMINYFSQEENNETEE